MVFKLLLFLTLFSCSSKVAKIVAPETVYFGHQRYIVKANSDKLKRVANVANCVTQSKSFLDEVRALSRFNFTNHTGAQVAEKLESKLSVRIFTYTTLNPWSATTAYRDIKTGNIFINTRKMGRSIKSMVNTFIHERLHNWYEHKGNKKTPENLESVPYKVGDLSEKHVKECL